MAVDSVGMVGKSMGVPCRQRSTNCANCITKLTQALVNAVAREVCHRYFAASTHQR